MTTKSYKQFVYCNNDSYYNSPSALVDTQLISGAAFLNYYPIVQLGIQAPPGTQFYLNGNTNSVIVGQTGLFDLDLIDNGSLSLLKFEGKSIERIKNNDSNILIIDILYLAQGDD